MALRNSKKRCTGKKYAQEKKKRRERERERKKTGSVYRIVRVPFILQFSKTQMSSTI